jgi:lipopolysaccharide exporter
MRLTELWHKARPMLNPRAETPSAVLSFALGSGLRLISSLVLTRLLYPEAYGIIAILMSVLFMIEMLSDIGVIALTIRHERGDDPLFLNTIWTIRIVRCAVNAIILVLGAPWIAQLLGNSLIVDPLRVLALYFLANAIESMGFAVALRHRRSPLVNYIHLACSAVSTVFCIVYAYFVRDHWALIFAALLERVLNAIASHFIYPNLRPRLAWDRAAIRDIFAFARYVLPTSMFTMALGQLERVIFLRLFDLRAMGQYGVAGSVSGPVDALCSKISHTVLYPRYAAMARTDPERLSQAYYQDSRKPMLLIFALPAVVGGAGQHLIDLLYDPRYAPAGFILQCFMVRAVLLSYLRPSEQLLTALGKVQVQLYANIVRASVIVPLMLVGYQVRGLVGFVVALALEPLAAVVYVFWMQRREGLLDLRREAAHAALVLALWACAWGVAEGLARLWRS